MAGLALAAPVVQAQSSLTYRAFATGGVTIGITTNYAIIGRNTPTPLTPVVTFISATALSGSATLRLYTSSTNTQVTAGLLNSQTNTVSSTNGFSAGTVVVVQHTVNDFYERLVCAPPQLTNQIVFATAPLQAPAVGDKIFLQNLEATLPFYTNNAAANFGVNLSGSGIYSGQPSQPLLVDTIFGAGTNATINAISALFQ